MDMVYIRNKLTALKKFIETEGREAFLEAYKRSMKLLSQWEKKDIQLDSIVSEVLFKQPEEMVLYKQYLSVWAQSRLFILYEDMEKFLAEIALLKDPLNSFMDNCSISECEEPVRINRLKLLYAIRESASVFAKFELIESK